mmetsp:Transcript_43782/g.78610  ORF Transcript_43782/g.78610 Transcript_43782/m.78610 type:complete len:125 (-) Transcript_43782:1319-1693(-)
MLPCRFFLRNFDDCTKSSVGSEINQQIRTELGLNRHVNKPNMQHGHLQLPSLSKSVLLHLVWRRPGLKQFCQRGSAAAKAMAAGKLFTEPFHGQPVQAISQIVLGIERVLDADSHLSGLAIFMQ